MNNLELVEIGLTLDMRLGWVRPFDEDGRQIADWCLMIGPIAIMFDEVGYY